MKIQHVPLQWVHRTWPAVADLLAPALEFSGEYTLDETRTLLATDKWLLVVAVEDEKIVGAATVEFMMRPQNRVALITAIGGRLITNPDTFEQLKTLLRGFGATALEGAAREAIARLWSQYGFTEKHRVVGVQL